LEISVLKGGPNWRVDLDRRQARKVELLTIDWHVRDRIDRTLKMDVLRMGRLRAVDIHPVERKPSARQG